MTTPAAGFEAPRTTHFPSLLIYYTQKFLAQGSNRSNKQGKKRWMVGVGTIAIYFFVLFGGRAENMFLMELMKQRDYNFDVIMGGEEVKAMNKAEVIMKLDVKFRKLKKSNSLMIYIK
jgi:hypothetical protein